MKIHREHIIKETYRVASVRGQFDFDDEKTINEWDVNLDLPLDWSIGVIVGPSGSGKTTIGKEYFGADNYFSGYEWKSDSVVDDFPESLDIKDITTALSSVGFSSPPAWLQPFNTLSNGQKFRVEMARVLYDERDVVVVDEFTSVVDRNAAQIGSFAIQKFIRKNKSKKKLVLLSCHYDILDWLQPDWVYDVTTGKTVRGSVWQRPAINVEIYKCNKSEWSRFSKHHYLDASIPPAAQCFAAIVNGELAGFISYMHSMGHNRKRICRTVVLPDYQGIGLSLLMSNWLGEYVYEKHKMPLALITSHPALMQYCSANSKWARINLGHQSGKTDDGKGGRMTNLSALRVTASFIYVGDRGFSYLKGWKNA